MNIIKNLGAEILYLDKSPLTTIYIADYYDGFLEGLAFRKDRKAICLIQKIWWVEGSYPRLFSWREIAETSFDLENDLINLLIGEHNETVYLDRYPAYSIEYENVLQYFDENHLKAESYYCFCNSIVGPSAITKGMSI